MEIKTQEGSVTNNRARVVVSAHPIRERVIIDKDGNELSSLDPRRKQIIRKAEDIK